MILEKWHFTSLSQLRSLGKSLRQIAYSFFVFLVGGGNVSPFTNTQVKTENNKSYSISSTGQERKSSSSLSISLKKSKTPPRFLEEGLTVDVIEGRTAVMGGLCEGSPWPHIKCLFRGKEITEGGRLVILSARIILCMINMRSF